MGTPRELAESDLNTIGHIEFDREWDTADQVTAFCSCDRIATRMTMRALGTINCRRAIATAIKPDAAPTLSSILRKMRSVRLRKVTESDSHGKLSLAGGICSSGLYESHVALSL